VPRRKLREPFTFFVDECLGAEVVPAALRAAAQHDETIIVHRDRFPQGVDDEVWIREIAREGWVALTKDARLRYRPNEREAILRAEAAVMMVGDGKGEDLARTLCTALPAIRRALRVHDVPCIGRVDKSGAVYILCADGKPLHPPRLEGAELLLEPGERGRRRRGQQLERAGRLLRPIERLEHNPHPAAAQRTEDLETARARETRLQAGANIRPPAPWERAVPAGRSVSYAASAGRALRDRTWRPLPAGRVFASPGPLTPTARARSSWRGSPRSGRRQR
jgi:hypothetical protein